MFKVACGVKYSDDNLHLCRQAFRSQFADQRRGAFGSWRLEIDGTVNNLFKAASIVRAHAIKTGDIASVRLVRVLKDAKSPSK